MNRSFHRLAIVNRGEAAMRAIRAVRELNQGSEGPITLIALYTEVERQAMFVREADEAYCLDDGTEGDGAGHASGYLDLAALERALVSTEADAAWVGWGFVAERPEFAELCERLGIVFIGPELERDAAAWRQGRRQAARGGGRAARGSRGAAVPWRPSPKHASTRSGSAIRC